MSALSDLQKVISAFCESGFFKPAELDLQESDIVFLVRMRANPQRFLPWIFDGDWALISQHPTVGSIRVLRVVIGKDEVARAILRQGRVLYAYPFL